MTLISFLSWLQSTVSTVQYVHDPPQPCYILLSHESHVSLSSLIVLLRLFLDRLVTLQALPSGRSSLDISDLRRMQSYHGSNADGYTCIVQNGDI